MICTHNVVTADRFPNDGGKWPVRLLLDKSLQQKVRSEWNIRRNKKEKNDKTRNGWLQMCQTRKLFEQVWNFSTEKVIAQQPKDKQ